MKRAEHAIRISNIMNDFEDIGFPIEKVDENATHRVEDVDMMEAIEEAEEGNEDSDCSCCDDYSDDDCECSCHED